MVAIPFPLSSLPGPSGPEGQGRLVNAFAEREGERILWRRSPGSESFRDTGRQEPRGFLDVNGTLYAAFRDTVVTIGADGAVTALTGRISGAGPVTMADWHNLTRRASRAGVKLTQYRARDAWAARMLSEPRPAAEVIKDLGIRRETIAAVAPLLDLPAPEEMQKMLRGQPRGDWRDPRDGHGHPQSATCDADLEVN